MKKQKIFTFSKSFTKTIQKTDFGSKIIAECELRENLLKSGYLITNFRGMETITFHCTAAKANISLKERRKKQAEIDKNPINYSTIKINHIPLTKKR